MQVFPQCILNPGVMEEQQDCLPATPNMFDQQASPGSQ